MRMPSSMLLPWNLRGTSSDRNPFNSARPLKLLAMRTMSALPSPLLAPAPPSPPLCLAACCGMTVSLPEPCALSSVSSSRSTSEVALKKHKRWTARGSRRVTARCPASNDSLYSVGLAASYLKNSSANLMACESRTVPCQHTTCATPFARSATPSARVWQALSTTHSIVPQPALADTPLLARAITGAT